MAAVSASPGANPMAPASEDNSVEELCTSETLVEAEEKSGSLKPSAAKVAKKKKWKKPKDKPKRPLSAYNIFFRHERENLLYGNASGGGKTVRIGFSELAKNIAAKWKRLDPDDRRIYEVQADVEQHRYKAEVEEWRRIQDGGSPALSVSPLQDPDWTVSRSEMANILAANAVKPSREEEMFDQKQSTDALINQLMIAQLMDKYNQTNAMMNAGMNRMDEGPASMRYMNQQYIDPRMVDAEVQFNLNYMSSNGAGGSELDPFGPASIPRRMSMPTSIEQFAQMQQLQMQAEQIAMNGLSGGHGGRRLSMPIGIIDNTQNSTMAAERRMMGNLFHEVHQQDHRPDNHAAHELFVQQYNQSPCGDMYQGHMGVIGDEHGMEGANLDGGGSMYMPSDGVVSASTGRRMSMPLSLEQQVLERNSLGFTTMIAPQTRSMSMPMGMSMPTRPHRGEDSLDELNDILKEDGDLFDW